ncbi:hypothetical protein BX616_011247, partial [Lobosporangium transversale]
TTVQPGTTVPIAWQVSADDVQLYDTLSAELLCRDYIGPNGGKWRSIATLFTGRGLNPPADQFSFRFPDCGPYATVGSIQFIGHMSKAGLQVIQEDSCNFEIQSALLPYAAPLPKSPPDAEPTTTTSTPTLSTETETPLPSSPSSSSVPYPIRAPRMPPSQTQTQTQPAPSPSSTQGFSPAPLIGIGKPATTTTPDSISLDPFIIFPTTPSTIFKPSPFNPITVQPTTTSEQGYRTIDTQTRNPITSATGDPTVTSDTSTPKLTPDPGAGDENNGGDVMEGGEGGKGSVGGGNGGEAGTGTSNMPERPNSDSGRDRSNMAIIGAALGGVGAIACIAIVVASLVIIRRRKRSAAGRKSMEQWMESGSGGAINAGGAGGAMIETKQRKKFRFTPRPKDGYFYKMEDQDDNDSDVHSYMERPNGTAAALNSAGATAAAVSVLTKDRARQSMTQLDSSQPTLALPPHAIVNSITPLFMREATPSSFGESSSRTYSVSSSYSSVENSSTIRKYWEASIAARAEHTAHSVHHNTSSRSREAVEGNYDEGSIFGDGNSINSSGQDSESRMADILTLRSVGSGSGSFAETTGTATSSRYRYRNRRNTLHSLGAASSFWQQSSPATTLSSIPDSLMITEEEFLERLHLHQMQMQMQEQGYYDHHYHQEYSGRYSSRMTISRSNSIPSLTSSNDPFKTFDSNEVLPDVDPFSDNRADSRASMRADMH